MSNYPMPAHLAEHILSGRDHLVIAGDRCYMAGDKATFEATAAGETIFTIVSVPRVWEALAELADGRQSFTKRELGVVAACSMPTIDSWTNVGILPRGSGRQGHAREYAFVDLFSAALAAALRRKNVPLHVVGRAVRFLRVGELAAETVAR